MQSRSLFQVLSDSCAVHASRTALISPDGAELTYAEFGTLVRGMAAWFAAGGVGAGERVAVYLPKNILSSAAIYAASAVGAVFVPINPGLKPLQVTHILRDCGAVALLTSPDRARRLTEGMSALTDFRILLLTAPDPKPQALARPSLTWDEAWALAEGEEISSRSALRSSEAALAALLYTSGSTGAPKGVMVTHRNFDAGCRSVATYLGLRPDDRLITALPFSFDYGLNQLLAALMVGAQCVLHDYLFARDLLDAMERHAATGLAGVPTLWAQVAEAGRVRAPYSGLRYFTNSGGSLPAPILARVRAMFPRAAPFLMYGLTEAFRSTYLPPSELERRRGSIGKAIPGEEVLVFKDDGTPAGPGDEGELVHCGALVTQGYWRAPEATRERFRPVPGRLTATGEPEIGVWSGDVVKLDADGFLYFIGRRDGLIKTSGYRVSPDEIEAVVLELPGVIEVCAFGVADEVLGQRIVLAIVSGAAEPALDAIISRHCAETLPQYMQPSAIMILPTLPKNMNGKYDRRALAEGYLAGNTGKHLDEQAD